MSNEPIVIERTYNAPSSRVWKALTDKEQMKQWYFDVPAFAPVVGTAFEFNGGTEEKSYRHLCVVKEIEEGRKIAYSWRYDGYDGDSLVTFELFPEGDQTRVRLTHGGLESFPDNPDFAKTSFDAGWNAIIGTNLPEFVEHEHLNRDLELRASAETVWNVLIDEDSVKVWGAAFGEGVYAKTDWQQGSLVEWMSGDGEVGVHGIVEENDPQKVLRVRFWDQPSASDTAELGDYTEEYRLVENDGKTELQVTTGPLSRKDIDVLSPMWDEAMRRIERLCEERQD